MARSNSAWRAAQQAARDADKRARRTDSKARRAAEQTRPVALPTPTTPVAPPEPDAPEGRAEPTTGRQFLRRAVGCGWTSSTRIATRCTVSIRVVAAWLAGTAPDFARRKQLAAELSIPVDLPW